MILKQSNNVAGEGKSNNGRGKMLRKKCICIDVGAARNYISVMADLAFLIAAQFLNSISVTLN